MKYIKSIILTALAAIAFMSCEDVEDDRVILKGGTPPVLTVSSTNELVLTKAQENFTSIQFSWTNPGYEFSNGVSTHDVTYTLQIDTTGSNFSNPKMASVNYSKELGVAMRVRDLNNALSGLELKDFVPHNYEFRIRASLAGIEPVYSNVIKITITPYLDVVFPVPAKLFITGAATPLGWMAGGDPPAATQEFTKINPYTFVINSLAINASSPFLFVPVYGNWDAKYGFTGASLGNNPTGDTFTPGGADMVSPGAAKAYKITVNFKTGKYSFE
jgi:starch-binding outer membrane protein SusE/F